MSDSLIEGINGTYIGIKYNPYSIKKLIDVASAYQVPNILEIDKIHTTLIYSRNSVDEVEVYSDMNYMAIPNKLEIWKSQSGKNCLVLTLDSIKIVNRHHELMNKYNFTYDYPEFKPHITISYNIGNWDNLNDMQKYITNNRIYILLVAKGEYIEDLKLDWSDK